MHLDTTPPIDRLIADRRRYVGYSPTSESVVQMQAQIDRLTEALDEANAANAACHCF